VAHSGWPKKYRNPNSAPTYCTVDSILKIYAVPTQSILVPTTREYQVRYPGTPSTLVLVLDCRTYSSVQIVSIVQVHRSDGSDDARLNCMASRILDDIYIVPTGTVPSGYSTIFI
jgi:hypothetical protein